MKIFVANAVVKKFEGEERYGRFVIASTMFDVSFKEVTLNIIQSQILNNCDNCNLKYLSSKIDDVVQGFNIMEMDHTQILWLM